MIICKYKFENKSINNINEINNNDDIILAIVIAIGMTLLLLSAIILGVIV